MDINNNMDDQEMVQHIRKRRKISVEARIDSDWNSDGYFLQLSDQDLEDNSRTMAMAKLHVNENISLADKSLEFKLREISLPHRHRRHHQFNNNSFMLSDDSLNQTVKSRLNDTNNKSQHPRVGNDTIRLTNLVHFSNMLLKLPQVKLVIERYRPSNSSFQNTHVIGLPQKQYKRFTLSCSSCNALPSHFNKNVCKKCGASMIFCCRSCDYSCNNFNSMKNHWQFKHLVGPDRLIYCLHCDKKFSYKISLYKHYKIFHVIEAEKMKWNRQFLQFYLVSKSEKNIKYECYKCNYSSLDVIGIKQHIQIEHDPTIHKSIDKPKESQKQCQLNNQQTNNSEVATDSICNSNDLQKLYSGFTLQCSSCKVPPRNCHLSNCEGCNEPMIYRCLCCDFITNKYATINSHYNSKHKHNANRVIHCLHCDKEYGTKKTLRRHYKKDHLIEKAKVTNKKEQYAKFYTVSKSADNKDYQCYECDYISLDLVAVKNHIRAKHNPIQYY